MCFCSCLVTILRSIWLYIGFTSLMIFQPMESIPILRSIWLYIGFRGCMIFHHSHHPTLHRLHPICTCYLLSARRGFSGFKEDTMSKKEVTVLCGKCFNGHKHRGLWARGSECYRHREQSEHMMGNMKE